jgi:hypothetical protein
MKVYIGPYIDWIGPIRIAEKILFWKDKYAINKDNHLDEHPDSIAIHKLADLIEKIPGLLKFCEWNYRRQKRRVDVHIDGYDVWSMDHTLALIIVPMLKKLKEQKHGCPFVDDEDVPEHLRSTAATPLTQEEKDTGHTDDLWVQRWDWVLNEMIWTFEQHAADYWESQNHDRMENGRILFAKYYQSLWD